MPHTWPTPKKRDGGAVVWGLRRGIFHHHGGLKNRGAGLPASSDTACHASQAATTASAHRVDEHGLARSRPRLKGKRSRRTTPVMRCHDAPLKGVQQCGCPFGDRAALAVQPFGRGFPRAARQNKALSALRRCPCASASSQERWVALQVDCFPTLSMLHKAPLSQHGSMGQRQNSCQPNPIVINSETEWSAA